MRTGKLEVRVLPDEAFGLVHGKAGVITLTDGTQTSFVGSANESKSAWRMNYELVWKDRSAEFVALDLARRSVTELQEKPDEPPDPAAAVIETPFYRKEVGLWQGEMRELLGMPSAVWDGRHWVDEHELVYPASGIEGIRKCPRRVGIVRQCLFERDWLRLGCIIFSQYRDSIQWLADQLTQEIPEEPFALYSGPTTSGIMLGGEWQRQSRDELKTLVRTGELRLLLGTDAASEGLNLQRLARLINLDLPWNPTRLEQRKGRIQRIGQVHDTIEIYNRRYRDSVEDRVHELLSGRLQDIFSLFGQVPNVLEDVWVAIALGDKEAARRKIDEVPKSHPFDLRYTQVQRIDWESCTNVPDPAEMRHVLAKGW